MTATKNSEDAEDELDTPAVGARSPRGRARPQHLSIRAAAGAQGCKSLGPIHTHALWRGTLKRLESGACTFAAIRLDSVDEEHGRGQGTLRVSSPEGEVTETRFDFGATAHDTDSTDAPCVQLELKWLGDDAATEALQRELPMLRLQMIDDSLLRSPVQFRHLSLSPPPFRHGPQSPTLSTSVPVSSRRASSTPMSWASIVRGGPADIPLPSPTAEEEEEPESFPSLKTASARETSSSPSAPIGIPGAAVPRLDCELEFPEPCSPPIRHGRRRHASMGHMGAQMPITMPIKARAPLCGSFWRHTRLTVCGGQGKSEEVLDLRYFGQCGESTMWHSAPAAATRTLASAGRRIL